MSNVLQLAINGIAFGCIYALVAIEFSLIFRASGLINFGHDKFIVLGTYIFAGTMVKALGMNVILAFLTASVVMALFGAAVAAGIFNPLKSMSSDIYAVMGTIMLAQIITEVVRLVYGPMPFTVDNFLRGNLKVGTLIVPKASTLIIAVTAALLLLQYLLFTRTRLGKSMRCVAQDKVASALMGINVKRNIMITVAFSAVICEIIGIMLIPLFNIDLNMANMIGTKGFASGVIGGFGSISGSIVGGLVIGLVENFYLLFGPATYKDIVAFVLMILFLIVKPNGILGKKS